MSKRKRTAATIFVTAMISACATTAPETQLYLLGLTDAAPLEVPLDQPALTIGDLRLAGFIDQSGLVYQTSPNEISVARRNRWASPLDAQLRQTLYTQLARALDTVTVFERSTYAPADSQRIDVRVTAFHGHHDGNALVAGRWQLRDADGRIRQRGNFDRRVPLGEDGYEALVQALGTGWRQSGGQIAEALADILPVR